MNADRYMYRARTGPRLHVATHASMHSYANSHALQASATMHIRSHKDRPLTPSDTKATAQ